MSKEKFTGIVNDALEKGFHVYPILTWDNFDPIYKLWGSTMHIIGITGIDKDGKWECLDGAYPKPLDGNQHNAIRNPDEIYASMHNGQFVIIGHKK